MMNITIGKMEAHRPPNLVSVTSALALANRAVSYGSQDEGANPDAGDLLQTLG
jgi:hypothetical protein